MSSKGWPELPEQAPGDQVGGQCSDDSDSVRLGDDSPQYGEAFMQEAFNAEMKAWVLLDAVLRSTTIPRVVTTVRYVQQLLAPAHSPKNAVAALTNMTEAVKDCRHPRVAKKLADAERAVRDVLVWRVQVSVPFGSRELFIRRMKEAYGCQWFEPPLFSKLMNSHKHVFGGYANVFETKSASMQKEGRGFRKQKSDASTDTSATSSRGAPSWSPPSYACPRQPPPYPVQQQMLCKVVTYSTVRLFCKLPGDTGPCVGRLAPEPLGVAT